MKNKYRDFTPPKSKKTTGRICFICDLTLINGDLDSEIHKGFTIGNGKQLYWEMIWHSTGNVTVFSIKGNNVQPSKRWLSGDTIITVHFK